MQKGFAVIGSHPDKILRERLRSAMVDANVDQSALARRVGCTPAAINQILTGKTNISKFLPDIARELDVSVDWLRGSTEDPGRRLYSKEIIATELDAVLVPQVEIGLSMGGGTVLEDWPVVQQVPMSRSWLRMLTPSAPENLVIAPGVGDSMMPTLLDGDLAIFDRAQNTPKQQDRIWALTYGGWGMIKRLRSLPDGTLQINSDNAAVSPIVAYEGEAQVIGRVVGVVRRI